MHADTLQSDNNEVGVDDISEPNQSNPSGSTSLSVANVQNVDDGSSQGLNNIATATDFVATETNQNASNENGDNSMEIETNQRLIYSGTDSDVEAIEPSQNASIEHTDSPMDINPNQELNEDSMEADFEVINTDTDLVDKLTEQTVGAALGKSSDLTIDTNFASQYGYVQYENVSAIWTSLCIVFFFNLVNLVNFAIFSGK